MQLQTLANRFIKRNVKLHPITLDQIGNIREKTKLGLVACTVPRMKTGNNPFVDKIEKYSFSEGFINFQYEDEVNKQRKIEGLRANFKSLPRSWGGHLTGTPFILYKPQSSPVYKLYLRFQLDKTIKTEYRTLTGRIVPSDKIAPFFFAKNESVRQGVIKQIKERDYYVENILLIVLDGLVYYLNK